MGQHKVVYIYEIGAEWVQTLFEMQMNRNCGSFWIQFLELKFVSLCNMDVFDDFAILTYKKCILI